MLFNPANRGRNANVTQPDRRFSESSLNQVRPRLNIAAMSSLNKFSRDRPSFFLFFFFHGDAIEAVTRVEHKYNRVQCLSAGSKFIRILAFSLLKLRNSSFETVHSDRPQRLRSTSLRTLRCKPNCKKSNDNKRRKEWKISSAVINSLRRGAR